jgi:hypothetical protein
MEEDGQFLALAVRHDRLVPDFPKPTANGLGIGEGDRVLTFDSVESRSRLNP